MFVLNNKENGEEKNQKKDDPIAKILILMNLMIKEVADPHDFKERAQNYKNTLSNILNITSSD